jgi:hypothetical protein
MPNTSKSSKTAAAKTTAAANPELADVFTPRILNTIESVADLQKRALDIAAEQTAQWMRAWKQAFAFFPVTPATSVFGVASQVVQTAIENQKGAIDMVVEQTKSVTNINQVREEPYSQIAAEVTTSVRKSVERTIEAQKKALDFFGEQGKAGFESAKKRLGTDNGPAAAILDSFQRSTDVVIEGQKSVLSIAAQPFLTNSKN